MAEANLAVIITGRGKDLINEFRKVGDEADKSGKKTQTGWSKVSSAVRVAGAAIAGTAVAIGVSSVRMADAYEKSHVRLETALKNTGTSWEAQKKSIDAVSASAVKFGQSRTDVEGALAVMTTGMGSASKAMQNFQLVEDLAAAKGVPLSDAALAVTKASEGMLRPLKQMGIDLPIAAGGAVKLAAAHTNLAKAQDKLKLVQEQLASGEIKGASGLRKLQAAQAGVSTAQQKLNTVQSAGDNILKSLSARLGGSASAQSKTFEGRMKALHATMANVQIMIGTKLVPVLIKMLNITQSVVQWLSKHKDVTIALVAAIGLVVSSVIAYNVAMAVGKAITVAQTIATVAYQGALFLVHTATTAWTAAQILLNVALDANPIGVVIIAVAALAAGIIYAYKHFAFFRTAVEDVWKALQIAFDWVKDHWKLIFVILTGPVGAAVLVIARYWDTVKGITLAVWRSISGFLSKAWGAIAGEISHFVGVWVSRFEAAWRNIATFLRPTINVLETVIRTGFQIVDNIFRVETAIWQSVFSAAWNVMRTVVTVVARTIAGAVRIMVAVVGSVLHSLAGPVASVGSMFRSAYGVVSNIVGRVVSVISGMVSEVIGAIQHLIDWVANNADKVLGPLGSIADAAGKVIGIGGRIAGGAKHLLGFAEGGTVPGPAGKPQLAIVHGGETVVPRGKIVTRLPAQVSTPTAATSIFANSSSGDTYITIYAQGIDDFHQKVIQVMRDETNRNGSIAKVRIAS